MADPETLVPAPTAAATEAAPQPAAPQPPLATAETPPAAAGAPSIESQPSLLQQVTIEAPKEEPKPAEAKPEEKPEAKPAELTKEGDKPVEVKAEEAKPAEAVEPPKPEPVEYKYTLPETLKMDDALKGEVHKAFDDFRTNPAEGAQALIDLHAKSIQAYAEHTAKEQRRVFNETREGWRKDIMADPVIGGSGFETSKAAVARMRDLLVPKDMLTARKNDDGSQRLSVFDEFLETTGAGDHPALWRLLHNAARYLDE